jgi:hypothetical protein
MHQGCYGIEAITVKHIAHGEQLLAELSGILPVRVSSLRKWILTLHSQHVSDILKKDFGFIKMHNLSHAFSDIKRKGPSKNTDTRIGEHGHVVLHQDLASTNCRDELGQVTGMHEQQAALSIIRDQCGVYFIAHMLLYNTSSYRGWQIPSQASGNHSSDAGLWQPATPSTIGRNRTSTSKQPHLLSLRIETPRLLEAPSLNISERGCSCWPVGP